MAFEAAAKSQPPHYPRAFGSSGRAKKEGTVRRAGGNRAERPERPRPPRIGPLVRVHRAFGGRPLELQATSSALAGLANGPHPVDLPLNDLGLADVPPGVETP